MTKYPDLFARLMAEFPPNAVKRRQQAGRTFDYITARTAMNRLDEVLGPENWWCDYTETRNGLMCRLTIRLPDGSTITKADGGAGAGMADADNEEKSAFSDAFKRAAVTFGVARYLYKDSVPDFGEGRQAPPAQRASAPPSNGHQSHQPPPRPQQQPGGGDYGNTPHHGKGLYAWTMKQQEQHDVALLKWLNAFIQETYGNRRMTELDESQIAAVFAEGCRKLDEHRGVAAQEAAPEGDIPFDRDSAWKHLYARAEQLAMHLFGEGFDGSDPYIESALSSCTPGVPEHLRVEGPGAWRNCNDRKRFAAYYRAVGEALHEFQTGQVPA